MNGKKKVLDATSCESVKDLRAFLESNKKLMGGFLVKFKITQELFDIYYANRVIHRDCIGIEGFPVEIVKKGVEAGMIKSNIEKLTDEEKALIHNHIKKGIHIYRTGSSKCLFCGYKSKSKRNGLVQ